MNIINIKRIIIIMENQDCNKKIEYNKFEKINIYLTGYGPFQTIKENPAEKVSTYIFDNKEKLNTSNTSILYIQIFEVTTQNVDENINKLFNFVEKNKNTDKNTLHIIVSFGVAQNRLVNTIETLAQNYIYDLIKDQKINESNPDNFYSKNPVKNIVKGIQKMNDVQCKYSNDAGTYLCNYMYYTTLAKYLDDENVCSFFIHIPTLENYDLNRHEKFFRNFINVLEDLYIKGNEEKRKKIFEYEINEEEDEHIDGWNRKKKKNEKKIKKDKQKEAIIKKDNEENAQKEEIEEKDNKKIENEENEEK
jgi:pyroglutamyl-peptidase